MNGKKNKNLIIVIFPYLFISQKDGIIIEDLCIKPSFNECIDKEDEKIKTHLLNIARLFRFGDNKQISHWSYLITQVGNRLEFEYLKEKLDKFAAILRYTKLQEINGGTHFCQLNYFIFEIAGDSGITIDNFAYYRGILNGNMEVNFHLRDAIATRAYFPIEEISPLIVDINVIKNNEFFKTFYEHSKLLFKDNEDRKILRSMEWFNRSFSHNAIGLDLSEAIINVHTAFESLLRPEDEERGVKSQIKTAILNLLGHSEEIGRWFDNFWSLRNAIVHGDINLPSFLYVHPKSKSRRGHRHHLYVARNIFIKCLDVILKIRESLPAFGLEEELISNEIRIGRAIKILEKRKRKDLNKLFKEDAFKIISDLRNDDASGNKQDVKKLGELLLKLVKENYKKSKNDSFTTKIDEILNWKGKNLYDLALLYSKLDEGYAIMHKEENIKISMKNIGLLALKNAVRNFCNFATWRLFVNL